MYRLMVNVKGHWKVGIRTYDSLEDVELRIGGILPHIFFAIFLKKRCLQSPCVIL